MTDLPTSENPVRLVCGDALATLRTLPDACVHLVATDPPYFGVKDDEWDNQWPTADAYLAWVGELCREWKRVLKPNGSLYVFASTYLAACVEAVVAGSFAVLNRIVWAKPAYCTKAEMNAKDRQRSYFPRTEYVIFAEQFGCDEGAATKPGTCPSVKRRSGR